MKKKEICISAYELRSRITKTVSNVLFKMILGLIGKRAKRLEVAGLEQFGNVHSLTTHQCLSQ